MAATSARFLVFRDLRRLLKKTALVEVTEVFSSLKVMLKKRIYNVKEPIDVAYFGFSRYLSKMSGQRIRSMVWTGQETIFFLWLSAEASKTSNRISGPPANLRCDWQSDTNSVGCVLIQFQMALWRTTARVARVPFLKLVWVSVKHGCS